MVVGCFFLGNRIIPTSSPRMARTDAFDGQPAAFKNPPLAQSLDGVLGTRWAITTASRR